MKYQNVVLSEEALKRIAGDDFLPDEDLEEVKRALEYIRDEKTLSENSLLEMIHFPGTTQQLNNLKI